MAIIILICLPHNATHIAAWLTQLLSHPFDISKADSPLIQIIKVLKCLLKLLRVIPIVLKSTIFYKSSGHKPHEGFLGNDTLAAVPKKLYHLQNLALVDFIPQFLHVVYE